MKMGRFSINIMALTVALCVVSGRIGEVMAQDRIDFAGASPVGEQTGSPLKLTLSQLVQLVRERNEEILAQEAEWLINKEAVRGARSIFEPELVGSFQHEDNRQKNTVEETVSRQFTSVYEERNNDYSAAIEGLAPTGGRFSLGYMLRDMSNTLSETYRGNDHEYRTMLVASLRQPLLKSGGIDATMAGIRVAEADYDMSFQKYRQEMMRVISGAVEAYWDLRLTQEILKLRKKSVRYTEQILRDNRERFRTGKIAEIEVLEAESGVAERKARESIAEQALTSAINNVRTLFSSSAAIDDTRIEAIDELEMEEWLRPDFNDTLYKAFRLQPTYISTRIKVDREDIRLAFYKNQRWPQLDLLASYGLNGLDSSSGGSWDEVLDEDFKQWSIGLELRIPLGGGMKTRSELEAVKQAKRQALLELKSVEVALANVVDTAVRNVHSTSEEVGYYIRIVASRKQLLDAELARMEAGKSNSWYVLEREEDLREAQEAVFASLVKYQKAILNLEWASGSLLANHGIEAIEEEL